MQWNNTITRALGISYPVIQAPMLGITTPAMVAAVSNAGGLGSLPTGALPPEAVIKLIREVKALTSRPFAVNFFAHALPSMEDSSGFDGMQAWLQSYYTRHGLQVPVVEHHTLRYNTYKDQLACLLDEQVPIVSFTFGIPDGESIRLLQQKGVQLMGTATCVEEALQLETAGVNMIVAQGIEAGGHRGTFIPGPLPQIGSMALIPQIKDRTTVPVIAAGGIMDGRGVAAAMMLGADGVQAGSAFLQCAESLAIPSQKNMIAHSRDQQTVLTRAFSGRWARGIPNQFMKAVDESGLDISDYPVHESLSVPARKLARETDNAELLPVWAGQAAGMSKPVAAEEVLRFLVEDTERVMG